MTLNIVILAAGKGTRMRSRLPKVLQPLAGRPLLQHVMEAALPLQPERLVIVYGFGGEEVQARMAPLYAEHAGASLHWAAQAQQLGTGHAVQQALPHLSESGRTLILYGDVPLIQTQSLQSFVAASDQDDCSVMTVNLTHPDGYGRILRDTSGGLKAIVEERDASAEQRTIREVNTGIMVVDNAVLARLLPQLGTDNAQGECYLTDLIALARADQLAVSGWPIADASQVEGVNDRIQLAHVERLYQQQAAYELMANGVRLADPLRIDVRGQLTTGQDCFIDVNCVFEGAVQLGDNVHIEGHCVLKDCVIGANTHIKSHSSIDASHVGNACDIGPYARLRPGTQLGSNAKVGNFVETKNVQLGTGSKANHLSYLGDAIIGNDVNIGAGTITCNYDGVNKHRTEIEDGAFIGSNTALVAPVTIGAGATIGAGSTIGKPAPADKLTLTRAKQLTLSGWRRPQKSDEKSVTKPE